MLARGVLATAISASGGSAHAAASANACLAGTAAKQGHFGGVISPALLGCQSPADGRDSPVSSGSPLLLFHNGQVMGTRSTGANTVTPIFWHPASHPMAADYESLIEQYLGDVAHDSGQATNVFSTLTEYYGTTLTRVDADVEISPLSHEMMESFTDPDVSTGWYDAVGNENGHECAYRFDTPLGGAVADGNVDNQLINGHTYLTQPEFSNKDFANTGLGCLRRRKPPPLLQV